MPVGRRVLIRNAALLAAAQGCARRIPAAEEVPGTLDALGQAHFTAAQLTRAGAAVNVRFPGGGGVLVANLGTKYAAWDGDCPHAFCPLTWVPEDGQVECPCHGSRFASDGAVLNPPAITPLNTFPVTVDPDGAYTVHRFPGDGTFPLPGPGRKLVLDLAAYPQLAQVHGSVFGNVEGPPGPLIVERLSQTEFAALDAVCTHQQCRVAAKPDGTLHCPCHGSEFDTTGAVTRGPAASPLRRFPATLSGQQLIIDLS